MDNAVWDHVRNISISFSRSDSKSKFNQVSLDATTMPNNGVINKVYDYYNKCFFIAVTQCLNEHGYNIDPYDLARKYDMLDHEMIDTDNELHIPVIEDLAHCFNIRIEIFTGMYDDKLERWKTTPYPSSVFGDGIHILRILHKGLHFEYLTEIENGFLNTVDETTAQVVILNQLAEFNKLNTLMADCSFIEKLVKENPILLQEHLLWEQHQMQVEKQRLDEKYQQELHDLEFAQKINEEEIRLVAAILNDNEYAKSLADNL